MNFTMLPSLIALAALAVLFRAILHQSTSERVGLWLTGWILVLVHSVAQFVDTGQGLWSRLATAVSLNTLEAASVAFLLSFSPVATDRRRQFLLGAGIGVPAIVFTDAVIGGITSHIFYYVLIALALVLALLVIWNFYRKTTPYVVGLWIGCLVVTGGIAWAVGRGQPDLGIICLLAAFNFIIAALFWRRFERVTVGVVTTIVSFVAWGAVFPIATALAAFAPSVHIESEAWNIPLYFVAVGMTLILLEDQVQRSDYLADHDELTGLPNRRLLEDRLKHALARADRKGNKVAVLLLDFDRFKEINDTYGHRIGDLALQQMVIRLASRIRVSDTLARTGGDEFTVVSDVADAEGAHVLISSLETAFIVPFKIEGKLIRAGLSIGLALYPDDGRTTDELHAAADHAMYVCKRGQR